MDQSTSPDNGIVILERKRLVFAAVGAAIFILIYCSPQWVDAVDPTGEHFSLSTEGKGALAVFLVAGLFWVFEVLPIGVTSLLIGVLQAMFMIRPAKEAFKDFMDPSVLFIFSSIVIGMVFTKTGLTRRLAYKMLAVIGEKTSMIYLGCFVLTAGLTLVMAHTAVAATIYPLLMAVYSLYDGGDGPTRFGKGLFMGMAYIAGAGSIITLLGAARGAVAIEFFKEITGREISFFQLSYYMLPIGVIMTIVLWVFFMAFFRPEKKIIAGLREKSSRLSEDLGRITVKEILAALIVLGAVVTLSLRSFVPALHQFDKSAILLITTILFFFFNILDLDDLESIPWDIILLFSGAMSLGFCLWQTGAAKWLAIHWLGLFEKSNWFVFLMGISFFVMMMTNVIMNVAAIAISLPVALVIAPYLGIASEVILFSALVVAGMPFLLLVGAAPNAIAYSSGQFTSGEFFRYGVLASCLLMAVVAAAITFIWPVMGMQVLM
ncbi:MAG TPA: SLC13/DASS family transporter [Thermodesulfobacteriaceae bacterium]|nr:SLC13/DASS family transporter [Thermodesulfobacteriaceae bacterium]